jgi:hypothetical protein
MTEIQLKNDRVEKQDTRQEKGHDNINALDLMKEARPAGTAAGGKANGESGSLLLTDPYKDAAKAGNADSCNEPGGGGGKIMPHEKGSVTGGGNATSLDKAGSSEPTGRGQAGKSFGDGDIKTLAPNGQGTGEFGPAAARK